VLPTIGAVLQSDLSVEYRIEKILGVGGTATACLATRVGPDGESRVVVKVILPQIVQGSGTTASTIIKKEAVALGRMNERVPPCPFVVRLLDTGIQRVRVGVQELELPWLALEYVDGGIEGTTLEQRVQYCVRETGFAFDLDRAARAIQNLAEGLSEIHAVGVVHRDVTPNNVLCCGVGDSELFKLSDFGIARPMGLASTFGDVLLGTPGYVAPEQATRGGDVGFHSDVFSFACVIHFLLTAEPYFEISSPVDIVRAARQPERRSISTAPALCYELREQEAACQAIDLALARASAENAAERPKSPRALASSIVPWLSAQLGARPSRRWLDSYARFAPTLPATGSSWIVRHPPGDDRVITSVAWNGAGHCLAATTRGLAYWDGTQWQSAPIDGLAGAPRCIRRLTASSWLIGTARGALAEYSRDGTRELFRYHDDRVLFTDVNGDLEDVAVVLGEQPGRPPLLCALVGKHWLKPLAVEQASMLTSIARIDTERWLVAGRDTDKLAYAAIYRPLAWEIERVPVPAVRALLATAGHPGRRAAAAVGAEGCVVRADGEHMIAETLRGAPDLSAVALDVLGRAWAAGAGQIWAHDSGRGWVPAWHDPRWLAPFVGMFADVSYLAAVTVDGAVVECRSALISPVA
jgi:eukaryotic-like serine/threonine-protein kinase